MFQSVFADHVLGFTENEGDVVIGLKLPITTILLKQLVLVQDIVVELVVTGVLVILVGFSGVAHPLIAIPGSEIVVVQPVAVYELLKPSMSKVPPLLVAPQAYIRNVMVLEAFMLEILDKPIVLMLPLFYRPVILNMLVPAELKALVEYSISTLLGPVPLLSILIFISLRSKRLPEFTRIEN